MIHGLGFCFFSNMPYNWGMAKEIYLYSGIYSFTAEDVIRQMEENKNSDIVIRMNTNGGDPQAAYGMIAKMKEMKKNVTIKVDGKALSSGAFMLPFASKVVALNVSEFLIHRAAYTPGYEANAMTPAERSALVRMNNDLRSAIEKKVTADKFRQVTGFSYDQVFNISDRIDVTLTAEQMKDMGLVDDIIDINDSEIAAFSDKYYFSDVKTANVAVGLGDEMKSALAKIEAFTKQKNNGMDITTLKTSHPDVYATVVAEGIAQERDRVGSWNAFAGIDPVAVAAGIKSGKAITETDRSEFMLKVAQGGAAAAQAAASNESAAAAATGEAPTAASVKDKAIADFSAEAEQLLGIKK
jgi:ATP-dependent protease ClpP protease subunit